MTVTVKLDASLEERLRQRAAASGTTTSDVIRQALLAYLYAPGSTPAPSAHALGADLFGRHRGAPRSCRAAQVARGRSLGREARRSMCAS
jgi:plasmid stability protein